MSTGPGDPATDAPTTALPQVTDDPAHREHPPAPPARPRFEFRPPPSTVCTPRPAVLTASSVLWAVAAGMLLVAVVLPLVGVGDLWAEISALVGRDFPNESPATRDRAIAVVTAGLVGGGVLVALLQAGAAAAMRSGRPAARILLALLLALGAVHAVLMVTVAPVPTAVLLGGSVGLALVAAVLMFLPGTTSWLTRPRRH